jgi:hypothetical protein
VLVVVNEVQVAEGLRVVDVEDFRDDDGLDEVQENFLTCSFERFTIENGKFGFTSVFSSGFICVHKSS